MWKNFKLKCLVKCQYILAVVINLCFIWWNKGKGKQKREHTYVCNGCMWPSIWCYVPWQKKTGEKENPIRGAGWTLSAWSVLREGTGFKGLACPWYFWPTWLSEYELSLEAPRISWLGTGVKGKTHLLNVNSGRGILARRAGKSFHSDPS